MCKMIGNVKLTTAILWTVLFLAVSVTDVYAEDMTPNGNYGTFATYGRIPIDGAASDTAWISWNRPIFCGAGCASLDQSKYQDGRGYPNSGGAGSWESALKDARGKVHDTSIDKYLCLYADSWENGVPIPEGPEWEKYSKAVVSYVSDSDGYTCPKADPTGRKLMNINGNNPWPITLDWQPDIRFFGIDPRPTWQTVDWDRNTWEPIYGTGYSPYGDRSWNTPILDVTKSVKAFDSTPYGGTSGSYGGAGDNSGNTMNVYSAWGEGGAAYTVISMKRGSTAPSVVWQGSLGWDYPSSFIGNSMSDTMSANSLGQFIMGVSNGDLITLGTVDAPEFHRISASVINAAISGADASRLWTASHDGRYVLYGVGDYGMGGTRIADMTALTTVDVSSELSPGNSGWQVYGFGKDGGLWFVDKSGGQYWTIKRLAPGATTADSLAQPSCASQGCSYLYGAFTQFIQVFPDEGTSGKVIYPKTITSNWMSGETTRVLALKDASDGSEITFNFDIQNMDGYFSFNSRYAKQVMDQRMVPFNVNPNWGKSYLGFLDIDNPGGENGIRFLKRYNRKFDDSSLPYNEGENILNSTWYWNTDAPVSSAGEVVGTKAFDRSLIMAAKAGEGSDGAYNANGASDSTVGSSVPSTTKIEVRDSSKNPSWRNSFSIDTTNGFSFSVGSFRIRVR